MKFDARLFNSRVVHDCHQPVKGNLLMFAALLQCDEYVHRAAEAECCVGRAEAAGPIIVDLDGVPAFTEKSGAD